MITPKEDMKYVERRFSGAKKVILTPLLFLLKKLDDVIKNLTK